MITRDLILERNSRLHRPHTHEVSYWGCLTTAVRREEGQSHCGFKGGPLCPDGPVLQPGRVNCCSHLGHAKYLKRLKHSHPGASQCNHNISLEGHWALEFWSDRVVTVTIHPPISIKSGDSNQGSSGHKCATVNSTRVKSHFKKL